MRAIIRSVTNGILGRFGLEIRRRHNSRGVLERIDFQTVIDGGANVGHYTEEVRQKWPKAKVHAFEPTPHLVTALQNRFAGDPQVTINDSAIGGSIGSAEFHVTPDTVSSSLLQSTDRTSGLGHEVVKVAVTTLDHWMEGKDIDRPALLKLDIEGSELAALRSGRNLLNHIDFIELETTFVNARVGQPSFKELLMFMDEQGFELFDVYPGILDQQTGRANWADVLFARKGFAM